ncbi:MAG TPA: MFS transporter [Thermoanaerobaculia bacterium]|nr:MFS transporter [Thermoanaerobaculia bacterium]
MSSEPLFTRRFFGLWAFAFVTFFSAFQLLPAIPFRIMELGGSKATAGWFLTVYTFASAFAAPVMGTIADHVGRKRLLMVASALFIVFSLLYGVVTSIPFLLLIGIVHGALWSALLSSASAIMSDYIPISRRTEGLAYWGLAGNSAIAAAPLVGLLLLERGWIVLCLELSVLSVVMLVWSSRLTVIQSARPEGLPSLHDAWDWSVIRAAVSMAVIAFGYGGVTSFVAILSEERNIHPKSLFFTVLAITVVVVRIFTSRLGDIYGPKALLYPSYAAMPISFFLLASAQTRWELIVSGALLGIGFGGAWPAFSSFVLSHTDPERRARTFGSIVLAFDIGIGSGSLVTGLIAEHSTLRVAFTVAAALSLLAIPIFIVTSRSMRPANGPGRHGIDVAATDEHG